MDCYLKIGVSESYILIFGYIYPGLQYIKQLCVAEFSAVEMEISSK